MKTHWKQLKNPDYIGAYSLPEGHDMTVKITEVKRVMISGIGGRRDECTVAFLENKKPFILNTTNSLSIQNICNSPYIEDWIGNEITLFVSRTKYKGEDVECLRIRTQVQKKPELLIGTQDFKNVVIAIKEGYKIEDIKKKFSVSKDVENKILEF